MTILGVIRTHEFILAAKGYSSSSPYPWISVHADATRTFALSVGYHAVVTRAKDKNPSLCESVIMRKMLPREKYFYRNGGKG
jgi:hypothetical protein